MMMRQWSVLLLLVGCSETKKPLPVRGVAELNAEGIQSANVTASSAGFVPAEIHFKQGPKAQLVFRRDTDDTCATDVEFKAWGIKKELPKGQDVRVAIPTDKPGHYAFTCGMGMHLSHVVVQ